MYVAWILAWLRAFALTAVIEVPIAVWMLEPAEPSVARRGILAFFANLSSHPCVWFVFAFLPLPLAANTALAEAWAFVSEAAFYFVAFKGVGLRRAAATSLLANGSSFAVGLLLEPWLTP